MKEVVKREGCCLKTYIHLCLFLWEKKGFSLSLVPSIGLFGDFHLFQAGVGPSGHLYFQNNIKVCGSTCQFFVNFLLIFLEPLCVAAPESETTIMEIVPAEPSSGRNQSEGKFNALDFMLKRSYLFGFEWDLLSERLVMVIEMTSSWRYG